MNPENSIGNYLSPYIALTSLHVVFQLENHLAPRLQRSGLHDKGLGLRGFCCFSLGRLSDLRGRQATRTRRGNPKPQPYRGLGFRVSGLGVFEGFREGFLSSALGLKRARFPVNLHSFIRGLDGFRYTEPRPNEMVEVYG